MAPRRPSKARIVPDERDLERARSRVAGMPVAPVNMIATLARNRVVSRAMGDLAGVFFVDGLVDARLRELAILRMAWHAQCEYEFGQHVLLGRSVGISDDECLLLTRPLIESDWRADEIAVLEMVDDLYANDCVSDSTWAKLTSQFDDSKLIALLALPGAYRMAAGVFNSCGIQLDEGLPGWPTRTT